MQTRWYIRTAITNYLAVSETENPHTFIATPAVPSNGYHEQPHPVTFNCPYILEQCERPLVLKPVNGKWIENAVPLSVVVVP